MSLKDIQDSIGGCVHNQLSHLDNSSPSNSKSEDTSLDDLLSTLTDDFRRWLEPQLLAWHKAEVAKLLQVIEDEVIMQDNEHRKDMPVPDPDPFCLPSDHQNQLRRYQRLQLKKIKERL